MVRARNVGVWTQRIAIAAVVALIVGFAVRVGSTSSQSLAFRDPLVWLASIATGEVVQADSGSGEVTARVGVGSPNDSLSVLQQGPDALVLNRTTGEVSRIDGSTLAQAERSPISADESAQLIGWDDQVRVVTSSQVVAVDPTNAALGQAVDVTGLTEPTVDDDGTVWGLAEGRKLVAVSDSATDVVLDPSTRPFALVDANGEAFLLDGAGPDLRSLDSSGPGLGGSHCVGGNIGSGVVAGGSVESGRVVVMADPETGTVRMSDRVADRCTSAVIEGGAGQRFGPSVESNGLAYIPIPSTGEVVIVRVDEGSVVGRSAVTAPGRDIDLVVKDGTVWFNDPSGSAAGVLGTDGVVTEIDKFRQVEVSANGENGSGTIAASPQLGPTSGGDGDPDAQGTSGVGGGTAQGVGSNGGATGPLEDGELSGLVADFTYSKGMVEVGEEVTFADRSQGGPTAWTWDFGDGEFSTGPNAAHSWGAVGAYKVTLRIESPEGTAAASATIEVIDENTRTRPTADFRFSSSRVEVGQPVEFTDRTTGNAQTLEWDFGDGNSATGREVEHSWSAAGTYRVSLTATNPLGSDTSEPAQITVYDRVEQPTAVIEASSTRASVNQTVTFTSRSTGNPTELRWEFGDGTTGTGATVTHSFSTPGRYPVKLQVGNSAGRAEARVEITIDATVVMPVARIVANTTVAEEGQAIRFSSLSINSPDRLVWDFGDGSRGESGAAVSHTFSRAGNYRVTLTASNGAGSHTASLDVTIMADVPPPVAAFDHEPASPVRAGQPVQFRDRSGGGVATEWSWDWNDGTPSSSQREPTHVFANEGTYEVRLTVKNSGGDDSETRTIRVLPPVPRADFTWAPTRPNAGQAVQFTDRSSGSGVTEWRWDFGDGTSSSEQNPRKTFTERGSFNVTLTTRNAGGWSDPRSQRVDVNPRAPVAAFDMTPSSGITTATSVTFRYRATGGAGEPDSYVWTFSDGERFTGATVTRAFDRAGSHTVTLAVTNTGGADSRTSAPFTVTVPPPSPAFTIGATRLVGQPLALDGRGSTGAESYSWNFGNGGSANDATGATPSANFTSAGVYTITLTVTNSGGTRTLAQDVRIYAQPTASIAAPATRIVAGTVYQFNGTATGGDPVWSFSPGSGSSTNGRLTFPSAGTYDVTLTVTNEGGGRATDTERVTVDPPAPQAEIEAVRGGANGEVVFRNVSPVGGPFANADVSWSFGDGSATATGNEVRHTFDGDRAYTVTLTVRNVTGTDTATVTVPVEPTANFSMSPGSPTAGDEVTFTNTSTGGPFSSVEWFVEGTRVATGNTFEREFAAGGYDIAVRVTNLWGTATETRRITVAS